MINPSCNPKDWSTKRLSRQPKEWEGSKISVDSMFDKKGLFERFVDAIKVWNRRKSCP